MGEKVFSFADLVISSVARYQIAFNDPQTDKDLEDPENRVKLLKYLYRSSSDPKPVGRFQVTENMLAGIGQNQLGSLFTEKVCEFNFLSLKYRPRVWEQEKTMLMRRELGV